MSVLCVAHPHAHGITNPRMTNEVSWLSAFVARFSLSGSIIYCAARDHDGGRLCLRRGLCCLMFVVDVVDAYEFHTDRPNSQETAGN